MTRRYTNDFIKQFLDRARAESRIIYELCGATPANIKDYSGRLQCLRAA